MQQLETIFTKLQEVEMLETSLTGTQPILQTLVVWQQQGMEYHLWTIQDVYLVQHTWD